jgi:hypothetical protein
MGVLRMLRAAVIVLFFALLPAQARAEARIALLIGNQAYKPKVGVLKNPHEDVALVGAALKQLGFQVTILKDAGYRDLDIAIKRFITDVRSKGKGAISFFYYSGHGAANPDTQINYLIPVIAGPPVATITPQSSAWHPSISVASRLFGAPASRKRLPLQIEPSDAVDEQ